MLYQTKSYWISTLIFQCTSKRSSFERGAGGSLKFIYECPLYYMGGWVRMESDGFECEGRRGRWNFQLFCGNHKSFTHKKYFKGGKFCEALLYHQYLVLCMSFLQTFSATRMRSLRVFLISGDRLDKNVTPR